MERRAEERKNGARRGTGSQAGKDLKSEYRENGRNQERPGWDDETVVGRNGGGQQAELPRTFRQRAMYEKLMEEAVEPGNYQRALEAVEGNQGAPGIDRMKTSELRAHLEAHWPKIRAKLLAGTYVPSPVRRVEIPKPSGGTRMLGIPTSAS